MSNIKGSNPSYFKSALPVSAYYSVAATDWGQLPPTLVNADLAYNAGAGSLAMGTAFVKMTYVTALGETLPSSEASVTVSAGTGAVTVTRESVPSTGQPITGWNVYSASSTGAELLTNNTPIPIATTTFQITTYGAGVSVPVVDTSGVQYALPSVAANSSKDLFLKVPNSFSTLKDVQFMRPSATADPAGLAVANVDCVAPLWVASTAFNAGDFIVVNSILYQCIAAGTTGSTVPTFSTAKGTTTTDNSITWKSQGRMKLLAVRFGNGASSAKIPSANEYDFFQL